MRHSLASFGLALRPVLPTSPHLATAKYGTSSWVQPKYTKSNMHRITIRCRILTWSQLRRIPITGYIEFPIFQLEASSHRSSGTSSPLGFNPKQRYSRP
ncbi:hypothetical protein FPQ18DRAFT_363502 [Pyronema domesticum]|nr:hypothetical protein FPQ18DRAFT_363502 [Pyronema domesticum]